MEGQHEYCKVCPFNTGKECWRMHNMNNLVSLDEAALYNAIRHSYCSGSGESFVKILASELSSLIW